MKNSKKLSSEKGEKPQGIKGQEGYIQSEDAEIHYCRYGQGTPFLMLHGNMQDSSCFDEQVSFLHHDFQIITIDSRGHGKSSFGKRKLTIPIMAEDVLNVMDALSIDKAIIMGFSDGGNIALQLAVTVPKRVRALILIGANINPLGLRPIVRLSATAVYHGLACLKFIPGVKKRLELLSLWVNEPQLKPARLRGLNLPTLLFVGQYDLVEESHAKHIANLIPKAKLIIINNGRHSLLKSHWSEINPIITEFLNEHLLKTG